MNIHKHKFTEKKVKKSKMSNEELINFEIKEIFQVKNFKKLEKKKIKLT
jgi:hypothetical protein